MLSEHFDAFIEPRVGPSALPGWLGREADGSAADPGFAVYLAPLPDRWSGWAITGGRGVRLEAAAAGGRGAYGACGSLTTAEAGALIVQVPGHAGTVTLLGFAPDVDSAVELNSAGASPRTVPVINNLQMAISPTGRGSIRLRDTFGTVRSFRIVGF